MTKEHTIYRGCVVQPTNNGQINATPNGALRVSAQGKILECGVFSQMAQDDSRVVDFGSSLICPGFVDAHVHLPQYVFAGLGADELLGWLQKYTFPTESRFSDSSFARDVSRAFFSDLAALGTTTAAIYGTSHRTATDIAFDEADRAGVRAIIGMVLMERNGRNELHRNWAEVKNDCEELAERWCGTNPKLQFAITPRFAITCGEVMMRESAQIAKKHNLVIQTHLSENLNEIDFTRSLFPDAKDYTEIYERAGLLTSRTLLAHGIHLSKSERQRISSSGATIVHCATSNRYLQSGVFGYRECEADAVQIALGSDVAGGYELCMLHEMREALEASKSWNIMNRHAPRPVLTVADVFHSCTLGAARSLGLDQRIGDFAVGKEADFVVLNDGEVNRFAATGLYQSPLERLTRLIYRGTLRCVESTYVGGVCVHSSTLCAKNRNSF